MDTTRTAASPMTTADLLERLVSFDTTSRNANPRLIGFIWTYLDDLGGTYRVSSNASAQKANGFSPPHTTIPVGTVDGGTILNIIPEHALFALKLRPVPGDKPHQHAERMQRWVAETIEPPMKAVDPACGFTCAITLEMPGMAWPPDHPLATVIKQATGPNSAGKVSYGTEGGFVENAGIPTIIRGPGHIAQAHQPDEWIAEAELESCDRFLRRLAGRRLV